MSRTGFRHVYGPVHSRRLGLSLGIDLVPFKTCSYDCLYCQLGRTTNHTVQRGDYVPLERVLEEVKRKLEEDRAPDFIGLAGSGEPTLHAGIGDLIASIRKMTRVPVAVLTNGSLLWMPEVRRDLAAADLVMPSLDAPDQPLFERVNRPHGKIPFDRMVDGLLEFAAGFQGRIWLEVFLLAGLTDAKDRVQRIAALARRIGPERVQLNTVSRPPADKEALAVPAGSMERLRKIFDKPAEIITESRPAPPGKGTAGDEDILALLRRRPCTVQGIAQGLGLHPNDVIKRLDVLVEAGLVAAVRREDGTYYESKKTG